MSTVPQVDSEIAMECKHEIALGHVLQDIIVRREKQGPPRRVNNAKPVDMVNEDKIMRYARDNVNPGIDALKDLHPPGKSLVLMIQPIFVPLEAQNPLWWILVTTPFPCQAIPEVSRGCAQGAHTVLVEYSTHVMPVTMASKML